jgi:hypothetical protein
VRRNEPNFDKPEFDKNDIGAGNPSKRKAMFTGRMLGQFSNATTLASMRLRTLKSFGSSPLFGLDPGNVQCSATHDAFDPNFLVRFDSQNANK